jgi:hypothetical protein
MSILKRKRRRNQSNLAADTLAIDWIAAELAGRSAQVQLNKEMVARTVEAGRDGILDRMARMDAAGKAATADDAIWDIVYRSEKGKGLEGLLIAKHVGSGPGRTAFAGGMDAGKDGFLSNDPSVDIKAGSHDFFTGKTTEHLFQAKSSVRQAVEALDDPDYENLKIVVPSDVLAKLIHHKKEAVQNAVRAGRFVDHLGSSKSATVKEAARYTRDELVRRFEQKNPPGFVDRLQADVMEAATIGALIRVSVSTFQVYLSKEKLGAQAAVRKVLLDTACGSLQSGARVALARTMQEIAIRNGINATGKWAGRSFGAAASLLINTGMDSLKLAQGKISGKQFGLNFSKNAVIATATAISGPLGITVSASFLAAEFISAQWQHNIGIAAGAILTGSQARAEESALIDEAIGEMQTMQRQIMARQDILNARLSVALGRGF